MRKLVAVAASNVRVFLFGLLAVTTGLQSKDCNHNGVEDRADIANHTSPDCNENDIPDSCEITGSFDLLEDSDLRVGADPVTLLAVDLDGDGILDLATANQRSDNVSVLLGKGAGAYAGALNYAVGREPISLVAADLDGDGALDLANANLNSNLPFQLSILPGKGDGSFNREWRVTVRSIPFSLVAKDFNSDGRNDLGVGFYDSDQVAMLLGRETGGFEAVRQITAGLGVSAIVAEDLNRDGSLDLVTANTLASTISVFKGTGDASFTAGGRLSVAPSPLHMAALDIDGDGALDVAATHFESSVLSLLFGDGSGKLTAPRRLSVSQGSESLDTADLNSDGRPDLVLASRYTNDVSILLGIGSGSLAAAGTYGTKKNVRSMVVTDLDADGIADVATSNGHDSMENGISILHGHGDGTLRASRRFSLARHPRDMTVGDLDGGGVPDLAFLDWETRAIHFLRGDGKGRFEAMEDANVSAGAQPSSIIVADLNGDSASDLATANFDSDDVSVMLGKGGGAFQPARTFSVRGGTKLRPGPVDLVAADLNADGHLDLATANGLYATDGGPSDISVILGNGDGTFSGARRFPSRFQPGAIVAGDLDADGDIDLAATSVGTGVSVLLGEGDGTFGEARRYSADPYVNSIAIGDLNRDGKLDLVVTADPSSGAAWVLLGNGDGTFQPGRKHDAGESPVSVLIEDLDGNRIPDLIVVDTRPGVLLVLLGKGNGAFDAAKPIVVGRFPVAVSSADFDGDGRLDLVAANGESSDVSLIYNLLGEPQAADCDLNSIPDECDVQSGAPDLNFNAIPDRCETLPHFHRGDVNGDGRIDVSDGLCTLDSLFGSAGRLGCLEAADANNDHKVDCTDAVVILGYLFLGSAPPAAPGPPPAPCGIDPDATGSEGDLGCSVAPSC